MFRRVLALLILSLAAAVCARSQVTIGTSREEVLRLLGKPTSIAQRGDRELLSYPKGARIELTAGKVSDIRGDLPPVIATPTPPSEPPAPAPSAPPSAEPAAAPAPQAPTAPASTSPPLTPPPKADNAIERLSREIEKMEKPEADTEHHAEGINVLELLVSIVLHFGITIFALLVAFKYWEMEALWRGTLAIAGIDLAIYAVLELLGPVTSGLTTMGAVQSGIGTLVMVFTVQRFCFNKRLQNAVTTALAVKVVVQLCHMFIFVLLLRALFG